jgi:tRNA A-37 threonylcarbamoyl transferase component Bud32
MVKFKHLTNSEAYQIGDYYLLISEFLTGPNILEYLSEHPGQDCSSVLRQVHAIIQAIHEQGMVHGSLSFDSFRVRGGPNVEIGLADMSFQERPEQLFGSLHKNSVNADWEFFGILVNIAIQGSAPYFSK